MRNPNKNCAVSELRMSRRASFSSSSSCSSIISRKSSSTSSESEPPTPRKGLLVVAFVSKCPLIRDIRTRRAAPPSSDSSTEWSEGSLDSIPAQSPRPLNLYPREAKQKQKRSRDDEKLDLKKPVPIVGKKCKVQPPRSSLFLPSLTVKVSQLNENTLNPEDLRKFREWSEGKRPTRVEREAKWRQEIETRIRSELGKQADEPELDLALKEKRKGMGQMIQRQANLENKISILEANEKRLEESLAKLSKLRRTQELSLKAVENRYQDLEKTNESLVKLNQTKKAELWNAKKKIDDLEAERGLAQRELLEKTKQWREAKESLRNTGFQVKVVEKKLEDVQRARMNDKLRFENQSRALSAEKDRALQEAFGPAFKMHRDPTQKALEKQLLESQVSRDKLKEQMEEVGQSRDSAILGLRKVNDRLKQMRDVIEAGKGRELELEKQLTVSAQKIEALENQLKKAVDERGTLKASYVIKDKAATERMAAIVKSFNKALLEKRDLERELENVKNQA